jgi:hypothetical protein
MRNFRPCKSSTLLSEPAPHLAPGIAHRDAVAVEIRQYLLQQFVAAALHQPGFHLPRIKPERHSGAKRERRILAPIIIGTGVADFDGVVLHSVQHREAGHDLAGGEDLNLKSVVGDLAYTLGEDFARAVESVERFRPTRREPPSDLRHGLSDSGHGDGKCTGTATDGGQELTAFHNRPFRTSPASEFRNARPPPPTALPFAKRTTASLGQHAGNYSIKSAYKE